MSGLFFGLLRGILAQNGYEKMKPLFKSSLLLRSLLVLSLFLLPFAPSLWADTIYLLNGESLRGIFLGSENGYYKFQTQDGKVHCILHEKTDDLYVIQKPKGRPEKDETKDSILCKETDKSPLEKPKEPAPPLKEELIPEGKPLQKEGLTPEGQALQKEELTPEGKPLQKEKPLPKEEPIPKGEPSPKEKPLPKKELIPKEESPPKKELSQKEEPSQKKGGKGFFESFFDPILQIFRDFFKRYPLSVGVFLGVGNSQLVYTGPPPFATITYADLGGTDLEGDLETEYPNYYEGPLLRPALLLELSLERHYKPLSLQLGLDYSQASGSKGDRPLRIDGTLTVVSIGETRPVESKTEYEYTYNYLSLFFGPSYKIPSVKIPYTNFSLDDFYASAHLRLLLSGSYTLERNSVTARGTARESITETGDINKNGLGFGLNFGKKFNWPKNYKTNLNFSYSYDNFDLGGAKYVNSFYGLSLGLEF